MIESSRSDKPVSTAFNDPESTSLGRMAAAIAADDRGRDSGFALLDRGRDALSWRLILIDFCRGRCGHDLLLCMLL